MTNSEEDLQLLGCVIKGKVEALKKESSSCGVVLYPHQGIILSHGSLLIDVCLKNESVFTMVKLGELIRSSHLPESDFTALVDSRWMIQHSNPIQVRSKSADGFTTSPVTVPFRSLKCKFLCAFRNCDFHNAVSRIMPENNWTFNDVSNGNTDLVQKISETDESSICFNLLSYFLLLKTDPLIQVLQNGNMLSMFSTHHNLKLPVLRGCDCNIGDVAEIVATPFGNQNPSVFFNTYSCGVISNITGPNGCWILTDARCIPGSEGSPLFTKKVNQSRYLTGIIAASLCWKNKEWVGFSLACSLESIQTALSVQLEKHRVKWRLNLKNMWSPSGFMTAASGKQNVCLPCVTLVRVGSSWGSGIIVNKEQGIILTCSHVIKDALTLPVMIKTFHESIYYKALVIYSSSSLYNGPYDLAVLKCVKATEHLSADGVVQMKTANIGERAWVVGHALFSSDLDLQPSACAGVISKIIKVKEQPIMIQTTCAVHAGTSGGPLINATGDLLGIVVCNTIDKGSSSIYPHVNMSIPAVSVWQELQHYLETGDNSVLSSFKLLDSHTKRLWALDSGVLVLQ